MYWAFNFLSFFNSGRVHPVASVYDKTASVYDKTRQSRYLTLNYLFMCKNYIRLIFTTCFSRDAPSSGEAEYNTSHQYNTIHRLHLMMVHRDRNML
jgi:hypothetical protein